MLRASKFVIAAAIAATCTAAPLAGCVDLFHSTDFGGAATIADAAPSESGTDATPQDICAASPAEALAKAKRSCALLSACESPVGDNAIGRCLPNAIVAYDCAVSPLRPNAGTALAYWSCLAAATSCADVENCVYGGRNPGCNGSGAFTSCSNTTRVDCETPPTLKSENCAATGRSCTPVGGSAGYCTGTAALGCNGGSRCEGESHLQACSDGSPIPLEDGGKGTLDEGFDCAGFGGGKCVQNAIGASCKPASEETCSPTADVTCDRSVAVGCPSGFKERVDCAALTGRNNTCAATTGGRVWDVSRACGISATDGGSGCARDTCSGDKLVACVRGAPVTIDCKADAMLARCIQVRTFDGERPTCSLP